jgi:NADPH-dependent ferric siderophore reductase
MKRRLLDRLLLHLFVGEETAQVSYGPMLSALPREARVFGRFEIDRPEDQLEADQKPGPDFDLAWTYREGRSAASSESMVAAVRELDLPSEPGIAYLAGEARTIQMIRHHLMTERQWPRRSVITKPFWTPGRKGLD